MANKISFNKRLLQAIIDGKSVKDVEKHRPPLKGESESQIQQSCIRWFALQYPKLHAEGMLFHISNEGIRLGGMGARAKREGIVKGVADLCLSIPKQGYGALYIEMKKKGCYQRPEQKAWQQACEKHGNKYVVCKSLEEFITEINGYLCTQ